MNGRLNLLSTVLLALGAVDLPPPPRKEVDLAEAEQVMRDLAAAGISATDLAAAVGPEGFSAYGKAILEVHRHLLATGTTETSVTKLLGIFNAYIQPKPVDIMGDLNHLSFAKPMEKFDPLMHTGRGVKYPKPTLADMFADMSSMSEELRMACGRMLNENSVLVGETERGPVSEVTTLTASEFSARYSDQIDALAKHATPESRVDNGRSEPDPRAGEMLATFHKLTGDARKRLSEAGLMPVQERLHTLASFGEPVDSKDIAGGAGKSFEMSPGVAMGPNGLITVSEPQTIDLNHAYESGAPTATIGLNGISLAHVIFDRSKPKLKFNDISTTRPHQGEARLLSR